MASITFALDNKLKSEMSKFVWVIWSELAKQELIKQEKLRSDFEKFKEIVSESKLTEEDALKLAREVNQSLHKRYKKLYPKLE